MVVWMCGGVEKGQRERREIETMHHIASYCLLIYLYTVLNKTANIIIIGSVLTTPVCDFITVLHNSS